MLHSLSCGTRGQTSLVLGLLSAIVSGCSGASPEKAELRVGLIAPLTGALSENLGEPAREGAQLAVTRVNELGLDIAGRRHRVVLLLEDSQDNPEITTQVARRLINQERVDGLIGPILSRNAIRAAAVAEQQSLPMISPTASAPELTRDKQFVFRGTFVDHAQGHALARFAAQELEAKTAAVLYDIASAYNRDVAEIFRQAFEEFGGTTVAFEAFTTGERDFRAPLERIRATAPDVLLLPNYADEVPQQVQQARELGIAATFLGTDSWDGDVYPQQAEFAGAYFIDDWQISAQGLDSDASRAFGQLYRQTFEREPKSVAAIVYDSFGLLFEAIKHQDSRDPDQIRQGLTRLTSYRGVTGSFSFQGTGDPAKSLYIFRIEDKGVVFAKEISP